MIVDIKDIDPLIYESYTQSSNAVVVENLKRLAIVGFVNHVVIRIPFIDGYNTLDDIYKSKHFIEDIGYSNFDIFQYKTRVKLWTERRNAHY